MTVQMLARTLTYRCPHCGTVVDVDPGVDGSMLNCPEPGCGKPFRVEIPVAEAVATPPELILPPGVEPPMHAKPTLAVQTAPPAPLVTPPTPEQATSAAQAVATAQAAQAPAVPETAGYTIQLSMFRRYPFRCLGWALLGLAGLALLVFGEMRSWHWASGSGGLVAAVAALRLLVWWVRMRCTTLTLTNKRGVLKTGVFLNDSMEFDFAHIADSHFHQNMLMRWLNVGDLAIVGNDGRQFVIMAVPDPDNVGAHLQSSVAVEKRAADQPDMVVVQQPTPTLGSPATTV